jgi:hypothetical protein
MSEDPTSQAHEEILYERLRRIPVTDFERRGYPKTAKI